MFKKNLRPLSVEEWIVCALGAFFMGLGLGFYIALSDYGIKFFIFGLILEIPSFYLVFRHQREKIKMPGNEK